MALVEWAAAMPLPTAAIAVFTHLPEHCGLVFLDENGALQLLELAFHCKLRRKSPGDGVGWIKAAKELPRERLDHVAEMCDLVWYRYSESGIPYGFRYVASHFDKTGELVLGDDECGLTCATFVLAVFRSVGIELLKLEDWKSRSEDVQRFNDLVVLLESRCEDLQHVAAVKQQVKAIRYRPLEVAGGSSHPPPASFEQASSAAVVIQAELASRASLAQGRASR